MSKRIECHCRTGALTVVGLLLAGPASADTFAAGLNRTIRESLQLPRPSAKVSHSEIEVKSLTPIGDGLPCQSMLAGWHA